MVAIELEFEGVHTQFTKIIKGERVFKMSVNVSALAVSEELAKELNQLACPFEDCDCMDYIANFSEHYGYRWIIVYRHTDGKFLRGYSGDMGTGVRTKKALHYYN